MPYLELDMEHIKTNGDLLKTIFPNMKIKYEYRDLIVMDIGTNYLDMNIDRDWFDKEYEGEY